MFSLEQYYQLWQWWQGTTVIAYHPDAMFSLEQYYQLCDSDDREPLS
jgi:hypothetical protein